MTDTEAIRILRDAIGLIATPNERTVPKMALRYLVKELTKAREAANVVGRR